MSVGLILTAPTTTGKPVQNSCNSTTDESRSGHFIG